MAVNLEHFIPQMHHLLRKMPLITWLLCKAAEGITHSKCCILFTLLNLSSFPSSFFVFLLLYLMCSSPTRLPHFLFPLEPLPSQLLSLIHHLLAFFFLSICVFWRTGERAEDGLRLCSRHWLSFVLLICFISIWCWEEGWGGNAKTIR